MYFCSKQVPDGNFTGSFNTETWAEINTLDNHQITVMCNEEEYTHALYGLKDYRSSEGESNA
jgi:hypothetical protein